MRCVENMGLMDNTAIIFTTDHGFLFGEHGGHFGKSVYTTEDGSAAAGWMQADSGWGHDPLYEEIITHTSVDVRTRTLKRGLYDQVNCGCRRDADGNADTGPADS